MPAQFEAFKQLLADDTDDYSAAHIAAGLAVPGTKGRKSRQPKTGTDGEGGPGKPGSVMSILRTVPGPLCCLQRPLTIANDMQDMMQLNAGKGAKKKGKAKKRKRDSDDTADE